ncbi:MAG: Stp1/IreP family PP2C-type Ser/Thr phosphatase [Ardenticatenaceae bacterium]|nr:Stp1/IreP family PP2C-type Ser/Thr phosphatase [Ardenticatenaceae bacterium]
MTQNGHVQVAYLTDRGQVRDHNEDYVSVCEPRSSEEAKRNGWIYVVADGVGGADAGEVASSYACERTIYHYLENDGESAWGKRLQTAVSRAHDDLCSLIDQRQDDRRMGTTLVATVLADNQAVVANVGDSRGYHVRAGSIRQITKDHSLIAKLLDEGIITHAEAATLNIGNIILQSIGSEQPPKIDLFPVALEEGDHLLLCSDGLTNHVTDEEMADIVSQHEPGEASRKLVDLANERGGFDNITILILRIGHHRPQEPNGAG